MPYAAFFNRAPICGAYPASGGSCAMTFRSASYSWPCKKAVFKSMWATLHFEEEACWQVRRKPGLVDVGPSVCKVSFCLS